MDELKVEWTEYLRYRAGSRGFKLAAIEEIVRYSNERYRDRDTGRLIAVGRHGLDLIAVPYERTEGAVTPVTVHTTTRRQIWVRVKEGRYVFDE